MTYLFPVVTVATDQPTDSGTVRLLDRIAGVRRVAVVGLHVGAGVRTIVETLAAGLHSADSPVAVTCVPRTDDDGQTTWPVEPIALPDGALVVTAASLVEGCDGLRQVERPDVDSPLALCRVTGPGAVRVHGPGGPRTLETALGWIEAATDGPVLVAGSFERCGFASPALTEGVLLAVGADYSSTAEGSAAAARYAVEIFRLGPGDVPASRLCREAAERRAALAVDHNGLVIEEISLAVGDPGERLEKLAAAPAAVVLPDFLTDGFLGPLVRSSISCSVVVRDATRVRVSPVYFRAWYKRGARVCVTEPARLVAVATNPTRSSGEDEPAEDFRDLVAGSIDGVPVHDVRAEATGSRRRSWKFWDR